MLIFEIARIANLGQPIVAGKFSVPVRLIDQGDCLSTIFPPAMDPAHGDAPFVSVEVSLVPTALLLDEPGRAVSTILGDIESMRSSHPSNASSHTKDFVPIANLLLLSYDSVVMRSSAAMWIIQRELRRRGLDVCVDGSRVLIGSVDESDHKPGTIFGLNLVGRLDALSDRDGSLINRKDLQSKTVLIVGLGSVGSVLACDLARSGIGGFIIADHERLEWGNVVRHAAGLSDAGRLKSRIVADLIRDRNPRAEISEMSLPLASESREDYDRAVASADVVICATDNRISRLICNRLAIKHGKKIIFGGLSSGAYAGMVFQFRPRETMCYHCFVTAFPEAAADREVNESEYSGGPDGHLALDIAPITNLMAKLALVELQKQSGMTVPAGFDIDLNAPWFMWINRREREYSELAPLGSPAKGLQILQWRPVQMEKVEECPHCGEA